MLFFLASCSSVDEKNNLTNKVKAEEVRSLKEINSHAEYLVLSHPELNQETKGELRDLLNETINNLQTLKNEESQILVLLLKNSLNEKNSGIQQVKENNQLKKSLKQVYSKKLIYISKLIDEMANFSTKNKVNDDVRNDMMIFIRELR